MLGVMPTSVYEQSLLDMNCSQYAFFRPKGKASIMQVSVCCVFRGDCTGMALWHACVRCLIVRMCESGCVYVCGCVHINTLAQAIATVADITVRGTEASSPHSRDKSPLRQWTPDRLFVNYLSPQGSSSKARTCKKLS